MKDHRGHTHGEPPAGLRAALSLKLKSGWRFDPKSKEFVSAKGERLSVSDQLPKGSELVSTVPGLAKADPAKLSAAERDLARYVQLILPTGAALKPHLKFVQRWEPVETVSLPPEISLP